MAVYDLGRMLSVLAEERVDFILVGGVAAVLQGVPVLTQDVDVLYRIDEDNIDRLQRALERLNAVARHDPRNLRFDKSHLRTRGHKLSVTDAGPLDILGSINESVTYEDLISKTDLVEVAGVAVRVASLEELLRLKKELGRPKDLAMIPVIEATLREKKQS